MKKYVASRREICAGTLVKPLEISYKIYNGAGEEVSKEELAASGIVNFEASCVSSLRGMLFRVNDEGLTNDLIYTTPTNYKIEGIEPQKEVTSDIIIQQYAELDELLKYMRYGVDLTQQDLNQIYRRFIVRNWWLKHHMELFGWKKLGGGSYGTGGEEILPHKIYEALEDLKYIGGKPKPEEPGYGLIMKRK